MSMRALAVRSRDRDAVMPEVDENPFVEQPVGTENTLGAAEPYEAAFTEVRSVVQEDVLDNFLKNFHAGTF